MMRVIGSDLRVVHTNLREIVRIEGELGVRNVLQSTKNVDARVEGESLLEVVCDECIADGNIKFYAQDMCILRCLLNKGAEITIDLLSRVVSRAIASASGKGLPVLNLFVDAIREKQRVIADIDSQGILLKLAIADGRHDIVKILADGGAKCIEEISKCENKHVSATLGAGSVPTRPEEGCVSGQVGKDTGRGAVPSFFLSEVKDVTEIRRPVVSLNDELSYFSDGV